MDLGGSQLCGMLRLSFSQVVGVTGRLGAPLSRKVVVALGEHWAGGQFETDVRAGRLQRQHSSALILIRPRGFVGAITRREKRKRGCREKSWQTAGRLVDKKYKETDRRWVDDGLYPKRPSTFSRTLYHQPATSHAPKTHPPSVSTTSDALAVIQGSNTIHRVQIQTPQTPESIHLLLGDTTSSVHPPPKNGPQQ